MTYDYSIVNMRNIKILRDYLDGLPADYEDFDMKFYAADQERAANATPETGCGTSACAVGHGPAAGIPVLLSDGHKPGSQLFNDYCERVFISCDISGIEKKELCLWNFAFSCGWGSEIKEAVARLDLILAQSVPAEWSFEDRFAETTTAPEISIMDMLMQGTATVELKEGPMRTRPTRPSPTIDAVKS